MIKRINDMYNRMIVASITVILLSAIDLTFNIVNIERDILIATIICCCIGLVAVIGNKINFNKNNL